MRYLFATLMSLGLVCSFTTATFADTVQVPKEFQSDYLDNAALQYWQAFSQMPTLDKAQEELVAKWETAPLDDPAVKKLVDDSRTSMKFLQRAAKCKRCDWGLDFDDGFGLLLPHLAKARDLARLAALVTRYDYEHGNQGALAENGRAIMVMARHVGHEPVMVCLLVRFAIEGLVVDLVAPHVPESKAPYAHVVESFETLPAAPNLQQSILPERQIFIEPMIGKLKEEEAASPGAGLKLFQNCVGPDTPGIKQVASLDEAIKMIEEMLPQYDELEKLLAKPKSEFDVEFPKFKEKAGEKSPLVALMLPSVDKVMARQTRNDARMAMLLAAVAVVESGPEKLADIRDPFGDGPFEYKKLDKGFELRSKLMFEGSPVTLKIGK